MVLRNRRSELWRSDADGLITAAACVYAAAVVSRSRSAMTSACNFQQHSVHIDREQARQRAARLAGAETRGTGGGERVMLRHRGVGDGELAWCCQQTAAEGEGKLGCQRHNRYADFRIRLLQLLLFSHPLASGATHKSGTLFPSSALLAGRRYLNRRKQAKVTPLRER